MDTARNFTISSCRTLGRAKFFKSQVLITTNSVQCTPHKRFKEAHFHQPLYLFFNPKGRCLGKGFSPISCCANECLVVFKILLCYHRILRVIRFRGRQQCLYRKKCSLQSECWAPLVLQDVQTYCPTLAADIRVPTQFKYAQNTYIYQSEFWFSNLLQLEFAF